MTVTLAGLPRGVIAVTVYQDENSDGKLGSGLFGIPNEPYGFSNNARGSFGPPAFASTTFVLGPKAKTIRIKLST